MGDWLLPVEVGGGTPNKVEVARTVGNTRVITGSGALGESPGGINECGGP